MKTMIRLATGLVAALIVTMTTQCAPDRYVVHDVYRTHYYHHYDGGGYTPPTSYGSVNYTPNSYSPRSFEPVERF